VVVFDPPIYIIGEKMAKLMAKISGLSVIIIIISSFMNFRRGLNEY
jgi:hypothetical protein